MEQYNTSVGDIYKYLLELDNCKYLSELTFEFISGNVSTVMLVSDVESRIKEFLKQRNITDIREIAQAVIKVSDDLISTSYEANDFFNKCDGDEEKTLELMKKEYNISDEDFTQFQKKFGLGSDCKITTI